MLSNKPNQKITAFPFNELPQLSSERLGLEEKLRAVYTTLQKNGDWFQTLSQSVSTVAGTAAVATLLNLEPFSFAEILAQLPEPSLVGVVRIEPQGKRAFLLFDNLLAQTLVNTVLTSGRVQSEAIEVSAVNALDELRPLTPLTEAVLQYVIVLTLEKILAQHKPTTNFVFEDVIRDPKRLTVLAAHSDKFAVISLALSVAGREFYVKVILPLMLVQNGWLEAQDQNRIQEQRHRFANFTTEFNLVVGSVTLNSDDIAGLSVGDIVLLDECTLKNAATLSQHKAWSGTGVFCPSMSDCDSGYRVAIQATSAGLQTVIQEPL